MSFYCSAIALTVLLAGPLAVAAQTPERVKKVAPDTVTVFLDDGVGGAPTTFLVQPKAKKPQIAVQDAVGGSNLIPSADISFESGKEPWEADHQLLWRAEIKVKTQVYVDPNGEYKGRLIFFWPDDKPESFDFTVKDRHATDFTVSPSALDVTLGPGQPGRVAFRLANSGRSVIRDLVISSLGLLDSSTHHRVDSFSISSAQLGADKIAPEEEKVISAELPVPLFAGKYQGELEVLANGGKARKMISVTLQTRGPTGFASERSSSPWFPCLRLPFLLFATVLLLGAGLATLFEDWFAGGGLQRAEAVLSLRRSLAALDRVSQKIDEWEKSHGGAGCFPRAKTDLGLFSAELDRLLAEAGDAAVADLSSASQRFAQKVPFFESLWDAVSVATSKWTDPQRQIAVIRLLDQASAADLNAYREALRNVLETAETDAAARAQWALSLQSHLLPPEARLRTYSRNLQAKVRWMAWLYRAVLWLAVFFSAYLTFYANKFAFGTLQDYIGVFFWALGLTPTGAQLLTRVRSSQARQP